MQLNAAQIGVFNTEDHTDGGESGSSSKVSSLEKHIQKKS
jgi:hypothetical protein